jgi:hypothetical protein
MKNLSIAIVAFATICSSHASSLLTDEQINSARALANDSVKYEDFKLQQLSKPKPERRDWLTYSEFGFEYKGEQRKYHAVHGSMPNSNWGEVAVYDGTINPIKVNYSLGGFSDFPPAHPYLAVIQYEFMPAKDAMPAHVILEKIEAGYQAAGQGHPQACLQYFVDEFVTKRTKVNYVFSDLRNVLCQKFFPKYGFSHGIPAEVKDIKFDRAMRIPFTWVKNNPSALSKS